MENDNTFPDQLDEFRLQQQQLQRRRELARQMIAQGLSNNNTGAGYQGGRVYMVGSPLGNVAQGLAGAYMDNKANTEQQDLAARQTAAQNAWQEQFNASTDPAEKQHLLATARNQGLRFDLEQKFADQEARQIEAGEQAAANRVETAAEKEANRAFLEQQKALDRQNRLDIRSTPTVHITTGGSASGKDPADVELDRQLKQARIDALRNPKPVASERKAALAQDDLISRVDNAMAELDRNPEAVGFRTFVPNVALNRADPKGTAARAAIGELGAEKAHEIYGASFTAAERARADKFIPADGDDLHTIRTKLAGMKKMAEAAKARAMGKSPLASPASDAVPTVVRTGKDTSGRKVEQMSDGTVRYAQ